MSVLCFVYKMYISIVLVSIWYSQTHTAAAATAGIYTKSNIRIVIYKVILAHHMNRINLWLISCTMCKYVKLYIQRILLLIYMYMVNMNKNQMFPETRILPTKHCQRILNLNSSFDWAYRMCLIKGWKKICLCITVTKTILWKFDIIKIALLDWITVDQPICIYTRFIWNIIHGFVWTGTSVQRGD